MRLQGAADRKKPSRSYPFAPPLTGSHGSSLNKKPMGPGGPLSKLIRLAFLGPAGHVSTLAALFLLRRDLAP
jgi:hypothetical protein